MKKLVILITILCSNFILTAQSGIKGKVTDEKLEGLINANIRVMKKGVLVKGVVTDFDGNYTVQIDSGTYNIEVSYVGYKTETKSNVVVKKNITTFLDFKLVEGGVTLESVMIREYKNPIFLKENTSGARTVTNEEIAKMPTRNVNSIAKAASGINNGDANIKGSRSNATQYYMDGIRVTNNMPNTESYASIKENRFVNSNSEQLSTFSLDVDRAAYSNVRRFINLGELPPTDAIRIEEMINYFSYKYAAPKNDDILNVQTSVVDCPWNKNHQLLHIGVQSKKIDREDLPPSNLVFLIDVSGSMNSPNKLPLVIQSFKILLDQLRPEDKVAIVTYAGNAGVALPSTFASNKTKILECLDQLQSGGSTAGAQGIITAYEIAEKNFIKEGNNRVVLATDGDFNVGVSDNKSLEKLIEEKRQSGVFLSVLGFGYGNYKDDKLQLLADKGNGNHAYIDDLQEAQKVFAKEFGGTIYTLAKDVKFQIEFNPSVVSNYRLIGYENRMLEKEDFNNDKIDAGELGMGHQMTAIYEIDLNEKGNKSVLNNVDELKYQPNVVKNSNQYSNELGTIKFRYKKPDSNISAKWDKVINNKIDNKISEDVKFSIAVAYSGLLLRKSEYLVNGSFDNMIALANESKGNDGDGYKAEFIRLMELAKNLKPKEVATKE